MSPEQRLATITLHTTNLANELYQLNQLRDKFRKAQLSARRRRPARRKRMRA
ncbi:MAG: hypothetical protein J0H38_06360 [Rhizobiales bacterium]|nr:hypothetical protein [Hyphomicrobiales bacterium]